VFTFKLPDGSVKEVPDEDVYFHSHSILFRTIPYYSILVNTIPYYSILFQWIIQYCSMRNILDIQQLAMHWYTT
jgi:hypothetical protein